MAWGNGSGAAPGGRLSRLLDDLRQNDPHRGHGQRPQGGGGNQPPEIASAAQFVPEASMMMGTSYQPLTRWRGWGWYGSHARHASPYNPVSAELASAECASGLVMHRSRRETGRVPRLGQARRDTRATAVGRCGPGLTCAPCSLDGDMPNAHGFQPQPSRAAKRSMPCSISNSSWATISVAHNAIFPDRRSFVHRTCRPGRAEGSG